MKVETSNLAHILATGDPNDLRDLLLEFWDPLHISETVEASVGILELSSVGILALALSVGILAVAVPTSAGICPLAMGTDTVTGNSKSLVEGGGVEFSTIGSLAGAHSVAARITSKELVVALTSVWPLLQ